MDVFESVSVSYSVIVNDNCIGKTIKVRNGRTYSFRGCKKCGREQSDRRAKIRVRGFIY